jgi:hypothetical protein
MPTWLAEYKVRENLAPSHRLVSIQYTSDIMGELGTLDTHTYACIDYLEGVRVRMMRKTFSFHQQTQTGK